MKNDEKVWTILDEKTFRGEGVFINGISYYEIKRGLLAVDAAKKLKSFDRVCKKFGIFFWTIRKSLIQRQRYMQI